jgi:REP element-mobilizing transposase RayT
MNHRGETTHTRGYLPHFVKADASYFVTFRLADSLPREVLTELENELKELASRRESNCNSIGSSRNKYPAETNLERERRKQIELHLDNGVGACWLQNEQIAEIACDVLRFFDGQRYELGEWVVMPNHVHAIVTPLKGWTLTAILHTWKLRIAREANVIIGKKGERFWQPESFDRIIRDEEEMVRVRRYIRRNPVKAALCAHEEDWRWGSAWAGLQGSGLSRTTENAQIGKFALHV